jgi:NAD(P)-dependent dehydrogenase (short-subunit alcohol dehydrogenase family)
MSGMQAFRYDGKRALVVGGATGMGAAAAQTCAALGGTVTVLDHVPVEYPVAAAMQVDLRDLQQLDETLAQLEGPIDALFCAAGVADGPNLMRINFISHRHIVETLVGDGRLGRGGAVCGISSVAGIGWEQQLPIVTEFLATDGYEAAAAWIDAHDGTDNYGFSKWALSTYIAQQGPALLAQGVRINGILPGPTDTPLAQANADLWLTFGQGYRDAIGLPHMSAQQMGDTMVFLNSGAASGINGTTVLVDAGHVMATLSGAWEPDAAIIGMLMGRVDGDLLGEIAAGAS